MATIKPGEKVDKDLAIKELWKKGVLYWKLNLSQKIMYDSFFSTKGKTCVFTASRRFGKSYTLLVIATEFALKNPNCVVKFVFPEKKMAKSVIRPLMRQIIKDCPKEIIPEYSTQDEAWIFKNGSEIQLAGADLGGADSLRGSNAFLSIIDEAGFCDDLDYIVQSILLPSMATTGGKLLMASTPPISNDHPFVHYALRSQSHKTFTIWDNVMIPEEEKLMLREEAGGEDAPSWRREYLCHFVTDATRAVIPEFVEVKKNIIISKYDRPQFYHTYESLDFGWARDNSVILFAYYDFDKQKLIVEAEWLALGTEATSEKMAQAIKNTEQELWTSLITGEINEPKKRVADTDYRVLFDLASKHQLSVIPTAKYDKDSALSDLRTKIRNEKILISDKCVNLIKQLEFGIWNKNRTSYQRSEALGHLDAVDALLYLVRNVDWSANPYPKGFGLGSRENTFIPATYYEKNQSQAAKWLKKVFKVKSSFDDNSY